MTNPSKLLALFGASALLLGLAWPAFGPPATPVALAAAGGPRTLPAVVPMAPGDTYYRFVHRNDATKARGWWGRDVDWDSAPHGISVFRNLDSAEYRAMAISHAQMGGWDPTDVAIVVGLHADSFAVYTADPIDSNGTWTDLGRAKHGVLDGRGGDTTFQAFKDSVAPRLAARAQSIYRGRRN